MGPTGEPVWVPTINGVEQFNELSTGKPTGIRIDDTLTEVAGFFHGLTQARFGSGVPTTLTDLNMLQTLEIGGDAFAYRDLDGCLAWKASKRMRKHFR
jgi:hypothetical protein